MTFSGKVAFITGGGSGMGHLAARNLAARGPLVAALHVNTSGLAQTAAGYDNINFASMAGWMPILYLGAYNASKFAVVAFSEVLYHQNRNRGVRFACVCPPPVSTPLLKQAEETVWVFPGRGTKMGWRMRRMFPGLMWKQIHKTEGF